MKTGGPDVTQTNGNSNSLTFTAPAVAIWRTEELSFELRVLDDYSIQTDSVTITVEEAPNTRPMAPATVQHLTSPANIDRTAQDAVTEPENLSLANPA